VRIVLVTWPLQSIVFKWRQNSLSTGCTSWRRRDTTWMRCATVAVEKTEPQAGAYPRGAIAPPQFRKMRQNFSGY